MLPWNSQGVGMAILFLFFFVLLPFVLRTDLFNDRAVPKSSPLRPDKLKNVIETLGVFVTNENVALLPFEDRIFEVDLNKGGVYVASRINEGHKAYVCLRSLPHRSFYGWTKNIDLNRLELVVVAKIIAILSQTFPKGVASQIEAFLTSNRTGRYVLPVPAASSLP